MNVIVRVDAGERIGLGHLTRTCAILEALEELGQDPVVTYVTRSVSLPVPAWRIPEYVTEAGEGSWIARNLPHADLVLADLYRPAAEQLQGLRQVRAVLVCVDDDTPHRFDCDLLVSPNLSTGFTHARTLTTRYLTGGEFVLLRRSFWCPAPRRCRREVQHLLLAFGGSDPEGLTPRVCAWLTGELPASVTRVTVLIGAAYPDPGGLARQVARDPRWQLQHNVAHVRELMESADVGILAAGSLLHEAASTGLPVLSVAVNTAQEREALCMHRAGATHYLGHAGQLTQRALVEGLQALNAADVRQEMADRAQAVIDGRGSLRVAGSILERVRERQTCGV
ncbi:MAG: hypothetical protein RMJ43_02655 [Chloroherpetonaceae bacterium]|nr:hypothetical protein [Chthonomonadaceae bacterium]MDW8206711.1 hypothetical protein [Chloroherpetonaceae bacterium]